MVVLAEFRIIRPQDDDGDDDGDGGEGGGKIAEASLRKAGRNERLHSRLESSSLRFRSVVLVRLRGWS